jgi:protein SCO1/2
MYDAERPRRARAVAIALIAAFALVVTVVVVSSGGSSPKASSPTTGADANASSSSGFDGAALPANGPPHEFTLADVTGGGRPIALSGYRGQVVILAYLYATCGDTCVVIAQQIRGALDELGGHPVPVLIVSADPTADTPARVRGFLAQVSLTGRAHWLTGSPARLRAVWRAYGVTPASAGRAAFDNSASVFLLDREGRERVLFQSEQLTPEGLSHDVDTLARR